MFKTYIPIIIALAALGISLMVYFSDERIADETAAREKLATQIDACIALSTHHFEQNKNKVEGARFANKARSLTLCLSAADLIACQRRENANENKPC